MHKQQLAVEAVARFWNEREKNPQAWQELWSVISRFVSSEQTTATPAAIPPEPEELVREMRAGLNAIDRAFNALVFALEQSRRTQRLRSRAAAQSAGPE